MRQKKTKTNSWQGMHLQELPGNVLTQVAAGIDVDPRNKQLRKEAANELQSRKKRVSTVYVSGEKTLKLVYGNLLSRLTRTEIQHLTTVFTRKEFAVLHGYFKGENGLEEVVAKYKRLHSLDGQSFWECVELLDMFQVECRRLRFDYFNRCGTETGLATSPALTDPVYHRLARRKEEVEKLPTFVTWCAPRNTPLPQREVPKFGKPQRTSVKTREPKPVAHWFTERYRELERDNLEALWECANRIGSTGWFSLSSLLPTHREKIPLLRELGYLTRMNEGWYRMRDTHFLVPRIVDKPSASTNRMLVTDRDYSPKEMSSMGQKKTLATELPELPSRLRELTLRALTNCNQSGQVRWQAGGFTAKDTPLLEELESLGYIKHYNNGAWGFRKPFLLFTKRFNAGEVTESEIRQLLRLGESPADTSPDPELPPEPEVPSPGPGEIPTPEIPSDTSPETPQGIVVEIDGQTESIGIQVARLLIERESEATIKIDSTGAFVIVDLEDCIIKIPINI